MCRADGGEKSRISLEDERSRGEEMEEKTKKKKKRKEQKITEFQGSKKGLERSSVCLNEEARVLTGAAIFTMCTPRTDI